MPSSHGPVPGFAPGYASERRERERQLSERVRSRAQALAKAEVDAPRASAATTLQAGERRQEQVVDEAESVWA